MRSSLLSLFLLAFLSFGFAEGIKKPEITQQRETRCKYKKHTLYKGPRGGCFYFNKNGNKTYVDRSYCNC